MESLHCCVKLLVALVSAQCLHTCWEFVLYAVWGHWCLLDPSTSLWCRDRKKN